MRASSLVCIGCLAFVTFLVLVREFFYRFQFHSSQRQVSCVFYDKPPRTGSTTVANVLAKCMHMKGYTAINAPISSLEKNEVVSNMLEKTGYKKSATRKHVMISDDDIRSLQTQCHRLLYVTSTRPMVERIASAAKYTMTRNHGNSTLTKQQYVSAMKKASADNTTEHVLEKYPFTGKMSIEPNYVIRSEFLTRDFDILLHNLGCDINYYDSNVHEAPYGSEVERQLSKGMGLSHGDARHKYLNRLANKRNSKGALMAKLF